MFDKCCIADGYTSPVHSCFLLTENTSSFNCAPQTTEMEYSFAVPLPSAPRLSSAIRCECFVSPRTANGFASRCGLAVALACCRLSCNFYQQYYISFSCRHEWRFMCDNCDFLIALWTPDMRHVLNRLKMLSVNSGNERNGPSFTWSN